MAPEGLRTIHKTIDELQLTKVLAASRVFERYVT